MASEKQLKITTIAAIAALVSMFASQVAFWAIAEYRLQKVESFSNENWKEIKRCCYVERD